MPKENQPVDKSLKVTDKRLFTAEGDLRDEYKESIRPSDNPQATPPPPAEPAPQAATAAAAEAPKKNAAATDELFMALVSMLAQNAVAFLQDPRLSQSPDASRASREFIDMLNVVQAKTEGNRSDEESKYLAEVLGQLKLAYVQKTKAI